MEINDYIRQRRVELKLTMAEVAQAVGVSEATVSRWESGHIDDIKRSRLSALAGVLRISPMMLIKDSITPPAQDDDTLYPIEFKKTVPVLGKIAAGTPVIAEENIEHYVRVENENIDFGLIVKGESMYPTLLPESTIFVQKDAEIENGVMVVAIVNEVEATVKRFYRYGNKVVLRPDNHNYQEQEYPVSEVAILGRVVEMRIAFT